MRTVCNEYRVCNDSIERIIYPRFRARIKILKPNQSYVAYFSWLENSRPDHALIEQAVALFMKLKTENKLT